MKTKRTLRSLFFVMGTTTWIMATVAQDRQDHDHDHDQDQGCPLKCFHNGKCARFESTSTGQYQYYCQCPSLEDDSRGFQGIHCEEPYIECTDGGHEHWRCHNHGKCNVHRVGCDCPHKFSGKFCEHYQGPCHSREWDVDVDADVDADVDLLIDPLCATLSSTTAYQPKPLAGTIVGIVSLSIFGVVIFVFFGLFVERTVLAARPSQQTLSRGASVKGTAAKDMTTTSTKELV